MIRSITSLPNSYWGSLTLSKKILSGVAGHSMKCKLTLAQVYLNIYDKKLQRSSLKRKKKLFPFSQINQDHFLLKETGFFHPQMQWFWKVFSTVSVQNPVKRTWTCDESRYHPLTSRVNGKPSENVGVKRRSPFFRAVPSSFYCFAQSRSTGRRLRIRPRVKQTPAAKTSSRITDRR